MSDKGIEVPFSELKERARLNKLKPTEADFKGKPGYYSRMENGKRVWGYKYTPNDGHGKLTREAQEVGEMMGTFTAESTHFEAVRQSRLPREPMLDAQGNERMIDSASASDVARRNGWRHRWSAGGALARTGIDGRMEFHLLRGRWIPTGYRLTRGERIPVSGRGIYFGPDGLTWKRVNGEWCQVI